MRKIKILFLLLMSIVLILGSVLTTSGILNSVSADNNPESWVTCRNDLQEMGAYNLSQTDAAAFALRSKSSLVVNGQDKVADNIFNKIMQVGGFSFGEKGENPFTLFGFAGLNLTSYPGEWKYVQIDGCVDNTQSEGGYSSNYGQFYEGRYEPQSSFHETSTSLDIRTQQYDKGLAHAISLTIRDGFVNIFLDIVKFIIAITVTMVGVSFSNTSEMIGLSGEMIQSIFSSLFYGIFRPFVFIMVTLTAGHLFYSAVVKKQIRMALQNFIKICVIFVLSIMLSLKPELLELPGKLANFSQAILVSTITGAVVEDNPMCNTTVKNIGSSSPRTAEDSYGESVTWLEKVGTDTRDAVGCALWSEFVFSPWVNIQWNDNYENLESIGNENSDWVGTPTVHLSEGKSIDNWALFQLSTQTDKHTPLAESTRGRVEGLSPDWWRIVDAISNIQYKPMAGAGGETGTFSEDVMRFLPDIQTELQNNGLDSSYATVLLGILSVESGGSPSLGDPFQASESLGLPPNTITDPRESTRVGVAAFASAIKEAESRGFSVWAAVQAYNYGNGYLDFLVSRNQKDHNLNAAVQFSQEQALKAGRPGTYTSINAVSEHFGMTEIYRYGYFHYVSKVMESVGMNFDDMDIVARGDGHTIQPPGAGMLVDVVTPVVPTKYWNHWIGNSSGRVSNGILATIAALLISAPLLVFSVLNGIYTIGIDLTMAVAPIFLLLSLWIGAGHSIFLSWLSTLFSTFLKKVLSGFMLAISILLSTSLMNTVSEFGVAKSFVIIGVISFILIKNRNEIIDKISRVNLPGSAGMNLGDAFSGASKNVANKTKKAAQVAGGFAVVSSMGAVASKRAGGSAKSGASRAAGEYLKNKAFASSNNQLRETMTARENMFDDDEVFGRCYICSRPVKKTDVHYTDENSNVICKVCGDSGYADGDIQLQYFDDKKTCEYCGLPVGEQHIDNAKNKRVCKSCEEKFENDSYLSDEERARVNSKTAKGLEDLNIERHRQVRGEYMAERKKKIIEEKIKEKGKEQKAETKVVNKEEKRKAKESIKKIKEEAKEKNEGKSILERLSNRKDAKKEIKKVKTGDEANVGRLIREQNKARKETIERDSFKIDSKNQRILPRNRNKRK